MIIFNVNRFFFNFAFFATPKLFLGVIDFFSPSKLFWSMSYFSFFNNLSNILTIFFQLFFCFSIFRRNYFSILWICLAFRGSFSKIWWHLHFVWLIIQNCNLQCLPFFSTMHNKSHFRVGFNFFDDFFQHQNLLSELDFVSFFNDCFIFFDISFSIFQRFFPTFFAFPNIWNCLN